MLLNGLALAACSGPAPEALDAPEQFVFDGRTYELDSFGVLFNAGNGLGQRRNSLFVDYLNSSPEGQARRVGANSNDPMTVWSKMAAEEKSAFVAITNALHCVEVDGGSNRMLDWVLSIIEIHGERKFGGGHLANSEAFRLYGRLTPTALDLLRNEAGTFRNTCNNETYGYVGSGSTHGDFCTPPQKKQKFDSEAKFDDRSDFRGIQFNFNSDRSDCTDIDVDYSNACHLSRGNSNVLDDCWGASHINRLTSEYGISSGLRLVRP